MAAKPARNSSLDGRGGGGHRVFSHDQVAEGSGTTFNRHRRHARDLARGATKHGWRKQTNPKQWQTQNSVGHGDRMF